MNEQATQEKTADATVVDMQKPEEGTPPALIRRDLTLEQWRVLSESIFPTAETKEAILMAVDYCRSRGLDVFKKPVHIVPMWSKKHKKMIETVWPGISEIRTTAARTGQYAGKDAPRWGDDIKATLGGVEVTFPEWCEITVYKIVKGHRAPYTGIVYWLEAYATAKKDTDAPNAMWRKRPRGQLAKCAEAEALREAFPEEIGSDYSAEEMYGQAIMHDVTPAGDAPPPPKREDYETPSTQEGDEIDAEGLQESAGEDAGAADQTAGTFALTDAYGEAAGVLTDPTEYALKLSELIEGCILVPQLDALREHNEETIASIGSPRDNAIVQRIWRAYNAKHYELQSEQQQEAAEAPASPSGGSGRKSEDGELL